VKDALVAHDWPGNVRALRHAAERAIILSDGATLALKDFPLPRAAPAPRVQASVVVEPVAADLNLDRAERQLIERALQKHGYNISNAASELGLTRGSLYRRMEKHGL
jgi:DNA-binding NtrC family response regulator